MVVLPEGRMSSRKGNIILFSQLKEMLEEHVYCNFLKQYEGDWPKDEINQAVHLVSLATIKWGMLNHDASKDIVFKLKDWAAKKGNTGPYLMYAHTRVRSMLREIKEPVGGQFKPSLLTHPLERQMLQHMAQFWLTVEATADNYNPSSMCGYLFDLAQNFSSWYEDVPNVRREADIHIQMTRLMFAKSIGMVIKCGLGLLGIKTLERM